MLTDEKMNKKGKFSKNSMKLVALDIQVNKIGAQNVTPARNEMTRAIQPHAYKLIPIF